MSTAIENAQVGRFYTTNARLVVVGCCNCGIHFAIPAELDRHARRFNIAESGHRAAEITCPAGHRWSYTGKNEAQELRDKLEREKSARARANAQRDQAKASAAAHKGHVTRIKRRIANGVCPCCNRTFKDVARHMKSQHPEFDPEVAA